MLDLLPLYFLLSENCMAPFVHIYPLTTYSANIWLEDYKRIRLRDIVWVYEFYLEEDGE